MASRREAMQAGIGGAIFGVAGGAKAMADSAFRRSLPPTMPYPSGVSGSQNGVETCDTPKAPLMDHKSALTKCFGDIFLRARVRAQLYDQYRFCSDIDPDLAVLKSVSPMAKIALTRQRRVERELQDVFSIENGPRPYSYARDMLNMHVQKLMWGNP